MKVYTKTGDNGTTQLLSGDRVVKHHPQIEAYGQIDQLNSQIGYFISLCVKENSEKTIFPVLNNIQNTLFYIGSGLACSKDTDIEKYMKIDESEILSLENKIDYWENKLPKLSNFILPGGSEAGSYCHILRCVTRSAERKISKLENPSYRMAIKYLNRLSDFFFVCARYINQVANKPETIWKT